MTPPMMMPKQKPENPAPPMAPDLVLVLSILKAMQTYLEACIPEVEARASLSSEREKR